MFILVPDLPTQWTSPVSKYSTLGSKACNFPLLPTPTALKGHENTDYKFK